MGRRGEKGKLLAIVNKLEGIKLERLKKDIAGLPWWGSG